MDFEYNITYRQKDGGWQYIISFKDRNGKWKQRSKQGFKTKRAAQIAADKRLDELKGQFELRLNTDYDGITFGEFSQMFLEHIKLYKEGNTAKNYRTAIRKFKALNGIKLSEVTSLHIQKCVDDMVKEELKSSTIQAYHAKLSAVFTTAIELYKIISENPVTSIKIPENKNKVKIKALNKSELENLLSKIPKGKHYIGSILAGKCGLRLGEIVGLTWSDIDFFKGVIKIDKQWKILKDGKHGFGSVKSKNSNRTVPVSQAVLKELAKYKKQTPTSIDGRILPYTHTNFLGRELSKHYKKAGYNITVHDLRHTYATTLIANGMDFKTVAELLGHDVKETIGTYSHVTSDMIDRAANIINNIF